LNAIILAAGEGKRLRPLTEKQPKCMVKLFGKSLLEWQLETMRSCGIDDISVVLGHMGDLIKFPDLTYFRNDRYDSTNMVETLFCAQEKMIDSIIVSYGDIVYEKKVLEKLIEEKSDVGVIVDKNWKKLWSIRFDDPLKDAESLSIDENGFIQSIGQKVSEIEKIQGQYIGLMKFQGNGLEFLKQFFHDCKNKAKNGKNPLNPHLPFERSYMTDLLHGLIREDCKIRAIPIEGGWLEVDNTNDYEIYTKLYEENSLKDFIDFGDNQ